MTAEELVPKAKMLTLIVSQLASYGFANLAKAVAEHTNTEASAVLDPSNLLVEYCYKGMKSGDNEKNEEVDASSNEEPQDQAPEASKEEPETKAKASSMLDWDTADFNAPIQIPNYTTPYITIHQAACRTAAYSCDGKLIATGSLDSTSKVFDASKIDVHSENPEDKPVIRTLYDHSEPVNGLAFHPNGLVLASCSDDLSTKLYDVSKPVIRRSFRYFQDSFKVNSICFHPSGDYLASGTDHTNVRVYDVRTFQCYTPGKPDKFHTASINSVRFSKQGNIIASTSMDGTIKIWDGVSGDCIRTFENAHKGAAVVSCEITNNNKYILTSGLDSIVRLWDISSGRVLQSYQGAVQYKFSCNAALSYDEKFIFSGDESTSTVVCWNALTGQLVNKLSGHTAPVRCIATSPVGTGFVSCSEDSRARFWSIAKAN